MWAVVPCKKLSLAKRRLRAFLSAPECRQLVSFMLSDVLGILTQSAGLSGVLVVSNDSAIADLSSSFGVRCLAGHSDDGLSAAFTGAGKVLSKEGADGVMAIPGDVPLLRSEDIARVLSAVDASPSVALVPDRHDSGTNLLAMRPIGAVAFLFGKNSLSRHLAAARGRDVEPTVIRSDNLGLDIDTREDLIVFARNPSATRTYDYIVESGILSRILGCSEDDSLRMGVGRG